MRDADYAKNMESAQKEYLVVKIAKNTNQKPNTPCPKKQGIFMQNAKLMHLHTICNAYAMQLNYIILN